MSGDFKIRPEKGTIEYLPSEEAQLNSITAWLNESMAGKIQNIESFNESIIDRYRQVGFRVSTVWWEMSDGSFSPDVQIEERLTPFNIEKMQQEIMDQDRAE